MTKRFSCAETAKLIRTALKEAFPEIKFSVRSSVYSMGASIRVNWSDGPIVAQVEPVVKGFAGASFNGMEDIKEYRNTVLNGEAVHFGADYVFTSREVSEARITALAEILDAKGREWWLTICCHMGHPHGVSACEDFNTARDVARSILSHVADPKFEGRQPALVAEAA